MQDLYTKSNAVWRPAGWPFFLPTLFGSGVDGDATLTTSADVGYLGATGVKNYRNASLASGQTLTVARGTSTGGLIMGCTGKLTIAGTITASGEAGANGLVDGGGKGGDTAGGSAGGAKVTSNGAGVDGGSVAVNGHGITSGGSSGAFQNNNAVSSNGGLPRLIRLSDSATYEAGHAIADTLRHSQNLVTYSAIGITTADGTRSASGTAAAVLPTNANYGPHAQATQKYFSFSKVMSGGGGANFYGGPSGGVTGVASQQAAGGGGGGNGSCVILEADTIELVSGYSIDLRSGIGGNGYSSNGTTAVAAGGSGGMAGICILICRTLIGSTAAINVSAGAAGTGAGTSAAAGLAGIAGAVYVIKV